MTLDPDAELIVRTLMRERSLTFKEAINLAIRRGAAASPPPPFRTATASLGVSTVNLDRALQLAAALEDDELIRRMRTGS